MQFDVQMRASTLTEMFREAPLSELRPELRAVSAIGDEGRLRARCAVEGEADGTIGRRFDGHRTSLPPRPYDTAVVGLHDDQTGGRAPRFQDCGQGSSCVPVGHGPGLLARCPLGRASSVA